MILSMTSTTAQRDKQNWYPVLGNTIHALAPVTFAAEESITRA